MATRNIRTIPVLAWALGASRVGYSPGRGQAMTASLPATPPAIIWHAEAAVSRHSRRVLVRLSHHRRELALHRVGSSPRARVVVAWHARPSHSRVRPIVPRSITQGEDALGVRVPKSSRWALCGGHGRHGAG